MLSTTSQAYSMSVRPVKRGEILLPGTGFHVSVLAVEENID